MQNGENSEDPMDEIYAIRRKISARFGHNVRRIAEAAKEWRRQDEAAGRRYVSFPIARVAPPAAYPLPPEGTGVLFACESSKSKTQR